MSASRYATIIIEQGLKVAAHTIIQDDPVRQARIIRGLALNALVLEDELRELKLSLVRRQAVVRAPAIFPPPEVCDPRWPHQ